MSKVLIVEDDEVIGRGISGHLANAGFDPQYGARPLRRAIQRLLEDELSERLLAGEIEPGQRVRVDLRDGRLNVETMPEAVAAGEASETGAHA